MEKEKEGERFFFFPKAREYALICNCDFKKAGKKGKRGKNLLLMWEEALFTYSKANLKG